MTTHDETASLLVRAPGAPVVMQPPGSGPGGGGTLSPGSISIPVTSSCGPGGGGVGSTKPVLMRQECTTILNSSHHPQLSVFSDSEEDGSLCFDENSRSVPDIEMHCRVDVKNCRAINTSGIPSPRNRSSSTAFQLGPPSQVQSPRCIQHSSFHGGSGLYGGNSGSTIIGMDGRRTSHTPLSTLKIVRSTSRESVRSAHHCMCHCPSTQVSSTTCHMCGHSSISPAMIQLSTSPLLTGNRIIRQSSQPESASTGGGCFLQHGSSTGSTSLRYLREDRGSDIGGGLASIAADSLRINGAMRNFKQGVLLCPQQTMAQSRRTRLKRALTEVTNDTVNYVRTVSVELLRVSGSTTYKLPFNITGEGCDLLKKDYLICKDIKRAGFTNCPIEEGDVVIKDLYFEHMPDIDIVGKFVLKLSVIYEKKLVFVIFADVTMKLL